jgi:hypothetical protein
MKNQTALSWLFYIAALYDGVLGLAFLFLAPSVFTWFDVTPPNHFGYVQFPGALLITFAVMFLMIARNPVANRNLILYGILLKISYCGVTFYHWFSSGIPGMWKPFTIIDLAFLALFIWAQQALKKPEAAKPA